MPDDNDLPLQDTPQSTEAANDASSEASHAASEDVQPASETLIQLALVDLQTRRDGLQQEIESLQQRKQQLEKDMAASFAGQSDAIARRVKGFQEYLGGALQGLAQSVETLELVAQPVVVKPSPLDAQAAEAAAEQAMANSGGAPALFASGVFWSSPTSMPNPGNCAAALTTATSLYSKTGFSIRAAGVLKPAAVVDLATCCWGLP